VYSWGGFLDGAVASLGDSVRGAGFSLADGGAWSLHPLRLLELVWPNILGRAFARNVVWPVCGQRGWFAGSDMVSQPVLGRPGSAVRGAVRVSWGRPVRRLAILSLFFVLLALGTFTPIYGLYRKLVWPEHLLRYPEKHMAAALLLWAALAGVASIGCSRPQRANPERC